MAINRYYSRTPAQPEFYHEPLDVLAQVLETKQKKYDQNFAIAEELANQKIDALPVDRARANQIVRGWQSQIDQAVQNAGGDYSRLSKDIYKLKRSMFNEMSPGGAGHAIAYNYGNYQKWLEDEKARVAKGEITVEDFGRANSYFYNGYSGIGQKDPATESYNIFSPNPTPKFVNYQDKAMEAASKVVANEFGSKNWQLDEATGTVFTMNGVKRETITPERIQQAVLAELITDPEIESYRRGMARYGVDVLDATTMDDITSQAVYTYAKDNIWTESDFKFIPEWMAKAKQEEANLANSQSLSASYNVDDFKFGWDSFTGNITMPAGVSPESEASTKGVIGKFGEAVSGLVPDKILGIPTEVFSGPLASVGLGLAPYFDKGAQWVSKMAGEHEAHSIHDVRNVSFDVSNPYGNIMSRAREAVQSKYGKTEFGKLPRNVVNREVLATANNYLVSSNNTANTRLNLGNDTQKALTEQLIKSGAVQNYSMSVRKGTEITPGLTWDKTTDQFNDKEMAALFKTGSIAQFNIGNDKYKSGLVWTAPGVDGEIVIHDTDAYVSKVMDGIEKLQSARRPEVFDTRTQHGLIDLSSINLPPSLGSGFYVKKNVVIEPVSHQLITEEAIYNEKNQRLTVDEVDEYGAPTGNKIPLSVDALIKQATATAIPQLSVLEGTKNSQLSTRN